MGFEIFTFLNQKMSSIKAPKSRFNAAQKKPALFGLQDLTQFKAACNQSNLFHMKHFNTLLS
ncbi:hypothetical protein CRI87_11455 [Liquorilactobacillus satsumensis]|nr:hypothetical protein [Liquorilactobacillus satsumensis]